MKNPATANQRNPERVRPENPAVPRIKAEKKTNWTAITVVEVIIGVAVRRALRIATSVTAKKKADPMAIAIAEAGVMTEVESPARSMPSRRSRMEGGPRSFQFPVRGY